MSTEKALLTANLKRSSEKPIKGFESIMSQALTDAIARLVSQAEAIA